MIGRFTIAFLQILVLTTILACGGAAQDIAQNEPPATGSMNDATLKSQTETVLTDINALAGSLPGETVDASVARLDAVRTSIDDLGALAAPTQAPQTTPRVSKGQQLAPPSRTVKPSGEPPTEEEIAAMERAVEFTHLPGPPLKEIDEPGEDGSLAARVRQASTDALAVLDEAEAAIRDNDIESARAALARAQEIIDELYASMP